MTDQARMDGKAECLTCNGERMVGGWSGGAASIDGGGSYENHPCPDCTENPMTHNVTEGGKMHIHDIHMTLKIGSEEIEITAVTKFTATPAQEPVYYGPNAHPGCDGEIEVQAVDLKVWGDRNDLIGSHAAPEWLVDYFYRSEEVKRIISEEYAENA